MRILPEMIVKFAVEHTGFAYNWKYAHKHLKFGGYYFVEGICLDGWSPTVKIKGRWFMPDLFEVVDIEEDVVI